MTTHRTSWFALGGLIAIIAILARPASAEEFLLRGLSPGDVFANPGVAALARAACYGNTARIAALAKRGVNVNAHGKQGVTPLIWAMTCHNYRGLRALLRAGADPNEPMIYGQSPVWLAAGGRDANLLPILLDHGGNANAYCEQCQGTSALENAIDFHRTANFKLLIKRGANVNFLGGLSPGQTAIAAGRFDYILTLLHHGYDHNLQDLADSLLMEKRVFNPRWSGYTMWRWQYPYWQKVLRLLAARGFHAHRLRRRTIPPPPPNPPVNH